MTRNKLLTILIPTYNSEKHLLNCLKSIQKQTFRDFKILCIEGGSNDSTVEIIKKNKLNIKIISKKDKSFEDGLNKSFRFIKTKYFIIVGSDDLLGQPNYIDNLLTTLVKSKSDIIFADYGVITNKCKKIIKQSNDFSCLDYKTVVPGLGWIAKKEVLQSVKFNCKLKVATDYDFFCRLYKKKFKFFRENKSVYYFRLGGNSFKNALIGFKEQKYIGLKMKGPKLKIYFTYYLSVIKFIVKFKILNYFFGIKNNI
jgi:glycosyltransferase involved in cell wall biosynthesis